MTTDYEALIESFVTKRLPTSEFEKSYLKAFKSEPGGMDARRFKILDKLFSDVDSYSPDCQEGAESPFEISEAELRRQAAKALTDLRRLYQDRPVFQP